MDNNTPSDIDLALISGEFDKNVSLPTSPSLFPTKKPNRSRLMESQEDDTEEFVPDVPKTANSNAKMNYLITWTKADTALMDREQFGHFICRQFEHLEKEKGQLISKWAVSCELHIQTRGCHYHMSLSLNKQRRWAQVAADILEAGIERVDFKSYGTTYFSIFDYVQKYDAHIVMSPGHEGLVNTRTNNAIRARKRGGKSRGGASRGCNECQKKQVCN